MCGMHSSAGFWCRSFLALSTGNQQRTKNKNAGYHTTFKWWTDLISDADARDSILIIRLSYRKLMFLHTSRFFLFFSFRQPVHCPLFFHQRPSMETKNQWPLPLPLTAYAKHVLLFCLAGSRARKFWKIFCNNIHVYLFCSIFIESANSFAKKINADNCIYLFFSMCVLKNIF